MSMSEDAISSSIKFLEEAKTSLANLEIELDKYKRDIKIDNVITDKERKITPIELISVIKRFARQHPDYEIVIDAPDSGNSAKCSSIHLVYEGMGDMIVLDAE